MYNEYMEKRDLISQVAKKENLPEEEVTKILDAFTDSIKEGLIKGEKVTISGFGTFSLSSRKATTFLNPKTNKVHDIPERAVPHFKAGEDLQNSLQ